MIVYLLSVMAYLLWYGHGILPLLLAGYSLVLLLVVMGVAVLVWTDVVQRQSHSGLIRENMPGRDVTTSRLIPGMHGYAVGLDAPLQRAYDRRRTRPVMMTRRRVMRFAGLVISLTLPLALILIMVESRQRASIVRHMEQRGVTIATNLAAVSTKSLLTYNFVTLEQDAEKTAQARDMLYAIILDRDGRVAAYSGQYEKQGLVLSDTVSQQAAKAMATLIQRVPRTQGEAGHYDIAVPVFVPDSPGKWGTVRVGLSLHAMQQEIAQTRRQVLVLGILGVAVSLSVAVFLAKRGLRTPV